jgi:predicted CXXCH cytochrome family protein
MKRLLLAFLLLSSARAAPGGSVVGSKHDLSVTGPGPIRAVSETSACLFCHISHAGRFGASNRPDSKAVYLPYESSTMSAKPGSPTGASRICLSCHDGTIAVGRTLTRDIPTVGGTIAPGASAHIGTDLRSSHPISFAPGASQKTRRPHPGDAVKYDAAGQVQCTSCHDPHKEYGDPQLGKFLVKPSARSQLCLSCHDELQTSAPASSHANASASFGPNEGNTAGRGTVGEAGCAACHPSHHGDGKGRLLNRPAGDDDALCLRCHSGTVARRNVSADLSKRSAHVSRDKGVHDAAEGRPGALQKLPEASPAARRHVSCVDCHDPHRASDRPASAAALSGALDGVWGVDRNGQRVDAVRFEYEVCLKCHGDSTNQPQPNPTAPRRAGSDSNLRLVFAADAASAHPVVTPGRGAPSPSLKPSWTPGSTIACGDCHASDTGPGAGGAGPRGPHGSSFPYLLERSYVTADFTPESPNAYALCYKCHDRAVLLSEQQSSFRDHALHVGPRVAAPCSACHTAHGVSARRASATGANAHLVDFDTGIVKPFAGIRRYAAAGAASGNCTLSCHGKDHDGAAYAPGPAQPPVAGVRAVRSVRAVKFR